MHGTRFTSRFVSEPAGTVETGLTIRGTRRTNSVKCDAWRDEKEVVEQMVPVGATLAHYPPQEHFFVRFPSRFTVRG